MFVNSGHEYGTSEEKEIACFSALIAGWHIERLDPAPSSFFGQIPSLPQACFLICKVRILHPMSSKLPCHSEHQQAFFQQKLGT